MAITTNMIDAIKVQFIKPIFEDDFVEKGMKAWLVDVEWVSCDQSYKLYFDFTEFEAENDKYFKPAYFVDGAADRPMITAKEAGHYTPKYSVYFACGDMTNRDDAAFEKEILTCLREVE